MVSAPSVEALPSPPHLNSPRQWPVKTPARIGLRVLLGAPLALLGVWAVLEGNVSPGHQALIAQTQQLLADGFSFFDLGNVYPPAPILLALAVGASATGLAVVSSMLAGSALHAAWERMMQRGVPVATQATMIASVTLIPSVWYLTSQDVATIGGLTMLVIALSGFIRFVQDHDTVGGFTAGLFIAAAFLFDPAALAYAVTIALATPLLAATQDYREPAATRALISVLCFPIVAVVLGWAFLEWRFDGSAFAFITSDLGLFHFEVSPLADLWRAVVEVAGNVAFVPVYIAVALLLMLRRPITGIGFLIPVAGLIVVRWSGLFYSPTATLVLLTLLAMVSVPSRPTRLGRLIIPAAAVAQLLMNVAMPPDTPGFDGWLNLLS